MLEAYLDHLRVERRLAGHTLESYGRDLTALAAFAAKAERRLDRLDRQALEEFVREQMSRGLSPRTVARMVAAVPAFIGSWCSIAGSSTIRPTTSSRPVRGRHSPGSCRWTRSNA